MTGSWFNYNQDLLLYKLIGDVVKTENSVEI